MIYRVVPQGDGFVLTVEDDEGVILSIPAGSAQEAEDLRERGVTEGVEALRDLHKPAKTARKKRIL